MKTRLFLFILLCFNLFGYNHAISQTIQVIEQGGDVDSSYYDIARVAAGEYWIGGEFGVLKKMNEQGQLSTISYPSKGVNILRIYAHDERIVAAADKGIIYVFNKASASWDVFQFPSFSNKCFYDIQQLEGTKVLLCGGKSGIARGKKVIPEGFIAIYDISRPEIEPEVLWQNKRKFVWTFAKTAQGSIQASVFNGFNSRIYVSLDGKKWDKQEKIKGLVHTLTAVDDTIFYGGCKSIRYDKNAIWGRLGSSQRPVEIENVGFICSLVYTNGRMYGFSQQGHFLVLQSNGANSLHKTEDKFAMYEAIVTDAGRICLVGHGKNILLIDVNE